MNNFVAQVKGWDVHRNDKTGIAFIDDGKTGSRHTIHPNIDRSGSLVGMIAQGAWKKTDAIARCNGMIYNISRVAISCELDEIVEPYCECSECLRRRLDSINP